MAAIFSLEDDGEVNGNFFKANYQ